MSLLKAKLSEVTEVTKTFLVLESFTVGPLNKTNDKTHMIAEFLVVDKRNGGPDVQKTSTREQVIRDLSGVIDPTITAAINTLCTFAKSAYDVDHPTPPPIP